MAHYAVAARLCEPLNLTPSEPAAVVGRFKGSSERTHVVKASDHLVAVFTDPPRVSAITDSVGS